MSIVFIYNEFLRSLKKVKKVFYAFFNSVIE